MKILLVSNYYYPEHLGGVEVVSYNLVKYYRIFGNSVRWLAADVPPKFRQVVEGDVPIRAWNIAEERLGFPHPILFPRFISRIWGSLQWCDVLHLQDCLYPINILSFLFAKVLRKPILITQHAKVIPYRQLYKMILQFLGYSTVGRLMLWGADKTVFVTANVRDAMQYLVPSVKFDVMPNGVDTELFAPLAGNERAHLREQLSGSTERPIILFVGRLVERKGVHLIRPLIEKYQD